MQRNVLGLLPLLAAFVAISVSGCQPAEESTGSAQFIGQLRQAVSASEVSRVTVTLTAADLPTRSVELAEANGQWGGHMGHIPSGTGRTFTAEAFHADGTKLFAGQVTGVTILKGQTTAVALVLQQVQAPPPFQNAVPIIDSLVASANSALPGGRITLQASAHDPNPSDTLTYAWTASAGTLSSPSSATTEWTAPQQAGQVTLTLAVTDPHGSVATLSMKLPVSNGVGDASLGISFNNWPVVKRLTAAPSRVEVGQSTVVTATALDSDGDGLSYQWRAEGCSGTWTEASGNTARFTPDAAPVAGPCSCRLGVQVGDGRGGTGQGTLSMCVGGAIGPSFPPEVVESFQSATTVSAQGTVRLRVEGQDPQGGALGFSWTADAGTLGVPASDATASEVVWTAPACLDALNASIKVMLSNTLGLTASHVFRVHGLPECTPLASGTWAAVGGVNMYRAHHAATLLPSGKVLLAGGMRWGPPWGAMAEVYDPKTNLSVPTEGGPEGTTAAVLLPTGKVLAIGASSAQLFDPAANRWSAAGAVTSEEFHTATLLPSSGKVLLAGGYDSGAAQQLAAARLYDVATGAWTDTQPMRSARSGHTATLLPSGKVLVTGGTGPAAWTTEVYDPGTGRWAPAASMAFQRAYHTALVLPSGKVLVVGGASEPVPAEVYDPETDTWLPAGGSASAVCMKGTATLLPSGKVLVTSCKSLSSNTVTTAEVYDPATGAWAPAGNLNVRHDFYTATLLPSGRVLVAGGMDSAMMEVYDPATGAWSRLGAKAQRRAYHTTVLLPSGKVLVMGGEGEAGALAELYDPATTAWTETGAMLSARAEHTATLLPSGKVLVVGGVGPNNGKLAAAEVYDPATGTWTPAGSLSGGRSGHTATLLPSGKVLVVGGHDASGSTLAKAEVYDPTTGTWSSTGALNSGRARHTATLLPSGQVLVMGGEGSYSSRVEVYDPVMGSWTLKAELAMSSYGLTATLLASGRVLVVTNGGMVSGVVEYDPGTDTVEWIGDPVQPRILHTATLLASGKVLIAGGGPPSTVTELYDPETKTWSTTGDFSSFRIGHTATRLASGKVLVVGGDLAGDYYSLATVYTP